MIIIKNIGKSFGDIALANELSTYLEFTFNKNIINNFSKYKSKIPCSKIKVCHAVIDLDKKTEVNFISI